MNTVNIMVSEDNTHHINPETLEPLYPHRFSRVYLNGEFDYYYCESDYYKKDSNLTFYDAIDNKFLTIEGDHVTFLSRRYAIVKNSKGQSFYDIKTNEKLIEGFTRNRHIAGGCVVIFFFEDNENPDDNYYRLVKVYNDEWFDLFKDEKDEFIKIKHVQWSKDLGIINAESWGVQKKATMNSPRPFKQSVIVSKFGETLYSCIIKPDKMPWMVKIGHAPLVAYYGNGSLFFMSQSTRIRENGNIPTPDIFFTLEDLLGINTWQSHLNGFSISLLKDIWKDPDFNLNFLRPLLKLLPIEFIREIYDHFFLNAEYHMSSLSKLIHLYEYDAPLFVLNHRMYFRLYAANFEMTIQDLISNCHHQEKNHILQSLFKLGTIDPESTDEKALMSLSHKDINTVRDIIDCSCKLYRFEYPRKKELKELLDLALERENVRTMRYMGEDGWGRPVYKCVENGKLWKDINLGRREFRVDLNSTDHFDGEPHYAIKGSLKLIFLDHPTLPANIVEFEKIEKGEPNENNTTNI